VDDDGDVGRRRVRHELAVVSSPQATAPMAPLARRSSHSVPRRAARARIVDANGAGGVAAELPRAAPRSRRSPTHAVRGLGLLDTEPALLDHRLPEDVVVRQPAVDDGPDPRRGRMVVEQVTGGLAQRLLVLGELEVHGCIFPGSLVDRRASAGSNF
jgi:hypothetical protein